MSIDTNMVDKGLRLQGICKSFPGVRALSEVEISVGPGEILALMGENGAGKSTLLKILNGIYFPDEGQILLDGDSLQFRSPLESRAMGIRVVNQEPDLVKEMTVAENIFLGELPTKVGRRVDRAKLNSDTQELLSKFRFGSSLRPEMRAGDLSPAQRQMIEIMRTLRGNLRVLALDEPTSSLSEDETEDLFDLIRQLRDSGVIIIYVSHRMNEIMRLADKVAVLRDGVHIATRKVAELTRAELIRMMVGRPLNELMRHQRHSTDKIALRIHKLGNRQLSDISFDVHAGEVVGLAGLIGAGRTEVAKSIFGAMDIDQGLIEVMGKPCFPKNPSDAIKAGIAYVPEERKAESLFADRSVKENISSVILRSISPFHVINKKKERAIALDYAQMLRVKTPNIDQAIGKLSGGNQQKAVLARWLSCGPSVLILDEPTRGIDIGAKAEIYELIEKLAMEGMAILLISSELPEVIGLSDRILCMQKGRITGELSSDQATEESVLKLCMANDMHSA